MKGGTKGLWHHTTGTSLRKSLPVFFDWKSRGNYKRDQSDRSQYVHDVLRDQLETLGTHLEGIKKRALQLKKIHTGQGGRGIAIDRLLGPFDKNGNWTNRGKEGEFVGIKTHIDRLKEGDYKTIADAKKYIQENHAFLKKDYIPKLVRYNSGEEREKFQNDGEMQYRINALTNLAETTGKNFMQWKTFKAAAKNKEEEWKAKQEADKAKQNAKDGAQQAEATVTAEEEERATANAEKEERAKPEQEAEDEQAKAKEAAMELLTLDTSTHDLEKIPDQISLGDAGFETDAEDDAEWLQKEIRERKERDKERERYWLAVGV